MWLLGGALGLLIGAAIGNWAGAMAGVIAGAVTGVVLRSIIDQVVARQVAQSEARIEHIYKALGDIHFRLKALEEGRAAQAAQATATVEARSAESAAPVQEPVVAPAVPPMVPPAVSPMVPPASPVSPAPPVEIPAFAPVTATVTEPTKPVPPPADLALPPLSGVPLPAANQAEPLALEPLPQAASREPVTARPAPLEVPRPAAAAMAAPAARRTAPRREPQAPAAPGFFARLFAGNLVAKAGVVILFFGVGFLLKYAYDHSILPPWTRLLGVALASAGLFYAGRRLLASRRLYALILMGGAFGFLYLDVFFALKWYNYIDSTTGFALFMALGVATVLTAVRMDARPLAVLGLFGAFLAPPLASTGSGSHVLLFSYYTLLNLFILTVSWFKAWRDLNLVGFFFTFVISSAWGLRSYRPELFGSVEPFVIIFFLIYLAIPILFATRQKPELKGFVDGTLVFGTPVAVAFMQARVVQGMGDHALAWSAGAAAALYALLGLVVRRREHMALLGETYIALATVLGTMTVFFALDAYPTFALWTLEGAAIVWIGLRQKRALARAFGMLLQVGAALYFLAHYDEIRRANPIFNDFVFGCALIAIAAWLSAWLIDRYREVVGEGEQGLGNLLLLWGFAWWFGGGLHALHHALAPADFAPAVLLFASATLLVAELFGAALPPAGWPALRRVAALHLGFIAAAMALAAWRGGHPLAGLGTLAWPLGLAVHFWILQRQRRDELDAAIELRDLFGWIAVAALATWDAGWLIAHRQYEWALLWALASFGAGWLRHRLREQEEGAQPISSAVLIWALVVLGAAGGGWLDREYSGFALLFISLACVTTCALLFEAAGSLGRWPALRSAATLLPLGMLLAALWLREMNGHPALAQGAYVWPFAFGVAWAVLWRQERDDTALIARGQHLLLFWLFAVLLVWEADASLAGAELQWQRAAWGVIPALLVALVVRLARREVWPFRAHAQLYREAALAPLLVVLAGWSIYANLADPGVAVPAMHLPLLNPLDVAQILILYAAWSWAREVAQEFEAAGLVRPVFGFIAFIWVNGVALRAIHYYAGVPYEVGALLDSVLTQSVLSLLWTSCALVLMTWASRRGMRAPWTVGAALLGVVVLKLVLNDLGNSGTVARIVSFLGVGAMLLLIGYMAPLPPGQAQQEQDGRG